MIFCCRSIILISDVRLLLISLLLTTTILLRCSSSSNAQLFEPLFEPIEIWRYQAGEILGDNGVYLAPDGQLVVSTSNNGNLYAMSAITGEEVFTYTPVMADDVTVVQCFGGVSFSYPFADESTHIIVYSVVENPQTMPMTRVIALDTLGNEVWKSLPLEGRSAGSPVVSFDGRYIFLTHNSNDVTIGHFTVLDTELSADGNIYPIYSEFNRTHPFSPPGIYHQPIEGYYKGGESNTNDVVVWAAAPKASGSVDGEGAMFIFQFPMDYDALADDPAPLFWLAFYSKIDFTAICAPAISNEGKSLYWAVSNNQFRSWVDTKFNENYTSYATFDDVEVTPPDQPIYNTPTLSSDIEQPMVFAGNSATQFVKMDHELNILTTRDTQSLIKSQAKVTPDDRYVFFTESDGIVHTAYAENLTDYTYIWVDDKVDGDFAMSIDGSIIFVGDVSGIVAAILVGTLIPSEPTLAPTLAPTMTPTVNIDTTETTAPEPNQDRSSAQLLHLQIGYKSYYHFLLVALLPCSIIWLL